MHEWTNEWTKEWTKEWMNERTNELYGDKYKGTCNHVISDTVFKARKRKLWHDERYDWKMNS